ncbi:hypothetical protein ACGFX4_23850 [Kitasatospora sp. NPDC048365]|uniref:hypothetical protein n=1 Tax=Kitasatospora sp. NPDC048365 TaxID=3364050 RepID=UPI003715C44A
MAAGEVAEREGRWRNAGLALRAAAHDPKHLPEYLALLAVRAEGPLAKAEVKDRDVAEVMKRGIRVTVAEGSLIGGPFIVLVPVAFCASLLAQLRMVLELAALSGADPEDEARAAELLVLQGVYPDEDAARAGLVGITLPKEEPEDAEGEQPKVSMGLIRRMAYLLGLLGADDPGKGRVRRAFGWVGIGILLLIGFVLPMVWIPAMGYFTLQATQSMGHRAQAYYGHPETRGQGQGKAYWRPGAVALVVRTLIAAILPAIAFLAVITAGIDLVGSRWGTALVIAAAVGIAWELRRVFHRWSKTPKRSKKEPKPEAESTR